MIKKVNIIDLKYKLKQLTNTRWKKFLVVIFSIFFFNSCYFFLTGRNVIERNIRALLYKAGIYTEEVKSVDINSQGWITKEEGSWHIDKSADWIDYNKAQVTIELTTKEKSNEKFKDIIFVLDISGSMNGNKLDKVKSDAKELTDYILSNSNNNIALITFDSNSEIITGLTNDRDFIINSIDNLSTKGATNYNLALQSVNTILNNYFYDPNREVVVLFLTDGYPNEDVPNQISQYKYLKERYPYILIEGIQYEMGKDIIKEIREITDNQFLTNIENLSNVLFEAALSPEPYEYFEIIDYIDNEYFHIESQDDISTDIGTFSLENNNQKIIWNLGTNSFSTGKSAKMTINLILNDEYKNNNGFYPTNTKEEIKSKLLNINEEVVNSTKTPVLKKEYKITYDTNEPKGCRLKTIEEEGHSAFEIVTKRNDELSCPGYSFKGWEIEENVTKINDDTFIMPSKDITIRGIWTSHSIYKSMEGTIHEKATLWKKVKSDAENGLYGANILSSTINDPFAIYYYNQNTNNNVYFANSCWKIIRTTDTGGVKILYNGTSTNNTCENLNISSTLEAPYSDTSNSLADVGYMTNKRYITTSSSVDLSSYKMNYMYTASNYRYFSNSYRKENGKYILENKDGSEVENKVWIDNYQNLTGYFTCHYPDTTSCSELVYITGGDKYFGYILKISDNDDLEDVNKDLKLGESYTKNSDGTYTLNNVSHQKISDWSVNYKKYSNKYICSDYTQITCTDIKIISSVSTNSYLSYENILNNPETGILYGNSFTYDGTNYHLVDTVKADVWSNIYDKLENNHYTCLNTSGTCSTLYYLTYTENSKKTYYSLTDGKGINDIINEMLYDSDVNKNDSVAKATIEKWYEDNLLDYTDAIEDTIYCNDREVNDFASLNPNGGTLRSGDISFSGGISPSLTCQNITDRFTVNSKIGNGALKYPVGLLTKKEIQLSGTGNLGTTNIYWSMTPYRYNAAYSTGSIVYGKGGTAYYNSITAEQFLLPVISLKNNIGYLSGNGTPSNPYVIE